MGIRRRLFQYLTIAVRPLQIDVLAERPVAFVGFNDDRPPQYCVDWQSEDGQGTVLSACSNLIAVVRQCQCRRVASGSVTDFIPNPIDRTESIMSSSKSCAFTSRTLLGDKPRFQYERMVTDIAPFINKHTQRSSEAIPLMTEGRRRRQGGERCLCQVLFYPFRVSGEGFRGQRAGACM